MPEPNDGSGLQRLPARMVGSRHSVRAWRMVARGLWHFACQTPARADTLSRTAVDSSNRPTPGKVESAMNRELSDAELAGWRKYWDGWAICPICIPKVLEGSTKSEWPVPANYCRPIELTTRCSRCGTTPPPTTGDNPHV